MPQPSTKGFTDILSHFHEADKYIRRFHNDLFIIKYGGAALENESLMQHFLNDVAVLHHNQIHVVLVHGGGPMLTQKMKEQGIPVEFKNGLRLTNTQVIQIARQVFSELNQKICGYLESFSCRPQPIYDGRLTHASLLDPAFPDNRVGLIQRIDTQAIDLKKIPVISSLGISEDPLPLPLLPESSLLNINADHLASELAKRLKARKLIFISDTPGILMDQEDMGSKIDRISETEIEDLIEKKALNGGMRLKVEMAMEVLKRGIKKVHFINGTVENSLLYEILTDEGIGTEIVC